MDDVDLFVWCNVWRVSFIFSGQNVSRMFRELCAVVMKHFDLSSRCWAGSHMCHVCLFEVVPTAPIIHYLTL